MTELTGDKLIAAARKLATEAHAGQKRKFTGEGFINHPRRVAGILIDQGYSPDHIATAWLHDVLEDTDYQVSDLDDRGIPGVVIRAVQRLTRTTETYTEYILGIMDYTKTDNYIPLDVKLADLEDNSSDVPDGSLKDKYHLAKIVLSTLG